MSTTGIDMIELTGLLVGATVIYGCAFILIRWIGRWAFTLARPGALFPSSVSSRVAGFVLAVAVYPNVAFALAKQPFIFVIDCARVLAHLCRDQFHLYQGDQFEHSGGWGASVAANVFESIGELLSRLDADLDVLLSAVVTIDTFAFIAIWLGAAWIISAILDQDAPTTGSPENMKKRAESRAYVMMSIVFVFGCYLSIASIIAEPRIDDAQSTADGSHEKWTKLLRTDSSDINYDIELGLTTHNFVPAMFELPDEVGSPARNEEDSILKAYQRKVFKAREEAVAGVTRDFRSIHTQTREALYQLKKEHLELGELALGQYALKSPGIIPADLPLYCELLCQWKAENGAVHARAVLELISELGNLVELAETAVREVDRRYASTMEMLEGTSMRAEHVPDKVREYREGLSQIRLLARFRPSEIVRSVERSQFPSPQDPGEQMAVFGLVAGWLLVTQSSAFVLIIGMLGFGLLGSSIAQVILGPAGTNGAPVDPLRGLAVVLVRGFSAAMVVFLTVKGGLALFTAEEIQPNPYVLFFTCMVGAVFSDKIWDWAKGWLSNRFPPNGGGATPDTNNGDGSVPSGGRNGSGTPEPDPGS